jgi:hypothetical protein
MRILELGWGAGATAHDFASRHNVKIACVTNSAVQTEICRKKFAKFGGASASSPPTSTSSIFRLKASTPSTHSSRSAMTLPRTFIQLRWSLAFDYALLGGGGGGPRSGAVGGAQRSGPPCRGVGGWAHPTEPRVWALVVVVGPPSFEDGACVRVAQ